MDFVLSKIPWILVFAGVMTLWTAYFQDSVGFVALNYFGLDFTISGVYVGSWIPSIIATAIIFYLFRKMKKHN